MKVYILFFLAFLIFTNHTLAQNFGKNCFEVKYLDFFGLNQNDKTIWSDEDLNQLLKMDYSDNSINTKYFIPFIVRTLRNFHPDCNNSIDSKRFDKFVSLYFKVRQTDVSVIENKSITEKLNFIRDDFYNLVKDEKLLPLLQYTWDDGPLYGEIPQIVPKTKPLETVNTDFGKLSIVESNEKIFLIATDKENKTIWSRIMKGTNIERYLRNLKFDKEPIEKTSLATIIHFYSEGERLNLYLKPDGKFMYYYHSW